jgi:hypothetical protein
MSASAACATSVRLCEPSDWLRGGEIGGDALDSRELLARGAGGLFAAGDLLHRAAQFLRRRGCFGEAATRSEACK